MNILVIDNDYNAYKLYSSIFNRCNVDRFIDYPNFKTIFERYDLIIIEPNSYIPNINDIFEYLQTSNITYIIISTSSFNEDIPQFRKPINVKDLINAVTNIEFNLTSM